jgi:hypothetical protein
MGFTLSFHFHPNEYFTDSVLTKHYAMKCKPEKDDPFGFEVIGLMRRLTDLLFCRDLRSLSAMAARLTGRTGRM